MDRGLLHRAIPAGLIAGAVLMTGCEVDSFFDPSRTGRFMPEPTMIPILDRIAIIEPDVSRWGETTGVMPEDLLPSDLTYILAPGDHLTVEIFDLRAAETWNIYPRRIDAAGNFRIAEIGDIRAAGRSVQEFEDHVAELMERFVVSPRVFVHVDDPVAFTYTVTGHVFSPGLYMLRKADLRLNEALAAVGGAPPNADRIYVFRSVRLVDEMLAPYDRPREGPPRPAPPPERPDAPPVDIEDLIEQLEQPDTRPGAFSRIDDETGLPRRGGPLAAHRSIIDIDELQPVREGRRADDAQDVRHTPPQQVPEPPVDEIWIYIEERGEWVRARHEAPTPGVDPDEVRDRTPRQAFPTAPPRPDGRRRIVSPDPDTPDEERERLVTQRVIEIPYERLLVDSSYDIVVRPNDRIVVEGPRTGFVYISGEINRPGVFDLPPSRERITLSRLVAAAGDLNPIAQPERVDITRMVGADREATIRVNLAAIRRRTEPDIYIKPGDHIHIGTSWIATPLAVIRNGFRVTYGFGFLLDRNFGSDVFGAPPSARRFE